MSLPKKAANDKKNGGQISSSTLIRRSVFLFSGILGLLALVLAALPWIASTQLIRNHIAIELGSWSGFHISIAHPPQIKVWPSFRAVLTDVSLHQPGKWDHPPFIEIENLEIDLSALAALSGNVVFTKAHMINPLIRLSYNDDHFDPTIFGEPVDQTINNIRKLLNKNKSQIDALHLPNSPFRSLELTNGQLIFPKNKNENITITGLSGKLDWPSFDAAGSLSLKGIWNNERVNLKLNSSSPLMLLTGGKSRINLHFSSAPLETTFVGELSLSDQIFLDGNIKFSTPLIGRAIEWSSIPLTIGNSPQTFSLSGKLSGKPETLEFQGNIQIDNDSATGNLLTVKPSNNPLKTSGTLAFKTLDIERFISIFIPSRINVSQTSNILSNQADFNLQISAEQGKIGSLEFSKILGNALIEKGVSKFDIHKASAFGGQIQAKLDINNHNTPPLLKAEFNSNNIDGESLGRAIGLTQIFPDSKASFSAVLNSAVFSIDNIFSYADGHIVIHFGKGNLNGLNLTAFLERARTGGFFALSEVPSGTVPINKAEMVFSLNRGIGRIRKALLESDGRTIMMSGVMPYPAGSLALSGSIYSREKVSTRNPGGKEITFFIGGSCSKPFISASPSY